MVSENSSHPETPRKSLKPSEPATLFKHLPESPRNRKALKHYARPSGRSGPGNGLGGAGWVGNGRVAGRGPGSVPGFPAGPGRTGPGPREKNDIPCSMKPLIGTVARVIAT